MAMKLDVGDQVTVRGPFDRDPILVDMQRHARIAAVVRISAHPGGVAYMIELCSAYPPGRHYGPFSAERLRAGWQ